MSADDAEDDDNELVFIEFQVAVRANVCADARVDMCVGVRVDTSVDSLVRVCMHSGFDKYGCVMVQL